MGKAEKQNKFGFAPLFSGAVDFSVAGSFRVLSHYFQVNISLVNYMLNTKHV